jgi:hypothetical protein
MPRKSAKYQKLNVNNTDKPLSYRYRYVNDKINPNWIFFVENTERDVPVLNQLRQMNCRYRTIAGL